MARDVNKASEVGIGGPSGGPLSPLRRPARLFFLAANSRELKLDTFDSTKTATREQQAHSPDGIVLFVIRPSRVSRQPSQRDRELGRGTGYVVRGVGLRAFDDQLRGGRYGGNLVGRHALVEAEIRAAKAFDR